MHFGCANFHKLTLAKLGTSQYNTSNILNQKPDSNLNNSQNILLRAQTAAIERNAIFLVLKIATAIPVRQKSALPFSYCDLCLVTEHVECAHDEIS